MELVIVKWFIGTRCYFRMPLRTYFRKEKRRKTKFFIAFDFSANFSTKKCHWLPKQRGQSDGNLEPSPR